jgi:hypothetical protein
MVKHCQARARVLISFSERVRPPFGPLAVSLEDMVGGL